MTDCTVYHNPACSKCRTLLALLQERGIAARLVDYRQTPPSAQELTELVGLLGDAAPQLLRRDEPEFAELGWANANPPPPTWSTRCCASRSSCSVRSWSTADVR